MLRPYQQEALDALIANIDRHCYVSLPTGSGKSHVLAELTRWALTYPETRILIMTHTRELVEQDYQKVVADLPRVDVSIYCAGLGEKRIGVVTVASIQSIHKIRDRLPSFDIIIVDEVHRVSHTDAGQYRDIFNAQPEARIVGLTATPYRMKGGLLHEGPDAIFDKLVYEARTSDLIEQGYLSRIRARATSEHADTSNLHIRGGEFRTDEMQELFDKDGLTRALVSDVLHHAADRKSIMVFCCSVEHCEHVRHELAKRWEHSVVVITGKTDARERDESIARFKARDVRILVNCEVLTTGFDAPNVDCLVLARATRSAGLYVQIVGRGLRICEGKRDCLLLDYGENVERFGPLDEITSERATSGKAPPPMKTCPGCETIIHAGCRTCPECSYAFPVEDRQGTLLATVAGDLDPIKPTRIAKHEVIGVAYYPHRRPNKPVSLRVEYQVGAFDWVKEWVCLEHTGFAKEKAAAWFARRGVRLPVSVMAALAVADDLLQPKQITVRKAGKYDEIIGFRF